MKGKVFCVLGLLTAIMLLVSTGNASVVAEGPELPRPPVRRNPPQQPPPYRGWSEEKPFLDSSILEWTSLRVENPAITLGQPGLSFRYVETFGVTEEAYPANTQYLNGPNGLYIDGDDNLFIAEEVGSRILKYNSSGTNLLSIGTAGLHIVDETIFNWPKDVTVDSGDNIWVVDNNRLTQFDSDGNYLQVFPDWDKDPWSSGTDNEHFDTPLGIAFDSSGMLYVSDTNNHRIQVYDLSGGSPVYSTTIGITATPKSDNTGFNLPAQIAFDSSDNLYVVDTANYRVQQCSYSGGWTCSTFHGTGSSGSGNDELGWAYGIGISSNDIILIADSANSRIKACNVFAICTTFAEGFLWPADVAVDSSGNVYVSDYNDFTIQKFTLGGIGGGLLPGRSSRPEGTPQQSTFPLEIPPDAQSTTGPVPPPGIDIEGLAASPEAAGDTLNVPAYLWHHGCGPTAAGMVIGYWDSQGFDALVPGDAQTQTASVDAMIASEGPVSNYTDYCEPLDSYPNLMLDKSEPPFGDEHPDDCVADYMKTSQSYYINYYGWSWFSDVGPAMQNYINSLAISDYHVIVGNQYMNFFPYLTWDTFQAEMDAGRPMVLLVDTDGNGGTDHFVPAVGYDDAGSAQKYACLNTWDEVVHWYDFRAIEIGQEWGIYGGTTFYIYSDSGVFIGTSGVPYVPDTQRYNAPWGIGVASDGSMYITEERGYRLVKLDANGIQQWSVGTAGFWGSDDDHLGSWWSGPRGNVGVDSTGRVYVPDRGNHRVQIFNASGTLVGTLGTYGTGNYQFDCPAGVAISPVNEDIYVADNCNHRIQVFDINHIYKATLGETAIAGDDNTHFNYPMGVAIDSSGDIFVADTDNYRVQKCTLSGSIGSCTTIVGETGVAGDNFSHLSPLSLTIDSEGRVYVSDEWNNRVQVFDANGAYLTTIGGQWGVDTGEMRGPSGVALDGDGNLYVTDKENHRIQKFSPGVPGWEQSNLNGFGDFSNKCSCTLAVFKDDLYAGTITASGHGAEIWRNTGTWAQVITAGFGNTANAQMRGMAVFGDHLYVGTTNENGGEIWRSNNGTDWAQVVSQGFDDDNNSEVNHMAVFKDMLYADTSNLTTGAEVWRSATGAAGTWVQVNTNGFGDENNEGAWSITGFNEKLYVGTSNSSDGGEIWRSDDGESWDLITEGFGVANNTWVYSLAVFKDNLYASTFNWPNGGQVWRSSTGNVGDWSQVVWSGFGDLSNSSIRLAAVHNGYMYATTANWDTGEEVWRTAAGNNWEQVNLDGFGDSVNFDPYWNNAAAMFNGSLYLGTCNWGNGGEVWQMHHQIYLPLIMK